MPIEILESRIAPAGFLVVTTADSGPGSLRNAITSANSNGATSNSIAFEHGLHGTIALNSSLPPITSSLSLTVLAGSKITIDGRNQFQIFNIQGSSLAVNISDLNLTRGRNGYGGAAYISDAGGTVKLTSCTITKSEALGSATATQHTGIGGAIDLASGSLSISTSIISGNIAAGAPSSTAYPVGGNASGGGIYVANGATLTMLNSTLSGNSALAAAGQAGAVGTPGAGSGASGGIGGDGSAGGNAQGGAIWSYGTVTLTNSTISGNVALGGHGGAGGRGGTGGPKGNGGQGGNGAYSGSGLGGGIYSEGPLTINSSTISGNVAAGAPGGAASAGGAAGSHGHAGLAGTAAAAASFGYGGGIHTQNSTIKLVQDTIAKNTADKGAGLFVNMDTTTSILNSTIAFNKANQQGLGGGMWAYLDGNDDPITVISTAIGQNTAGKTPHGAPPAAGQDLYVVNGYITTSYSLVQSSNSGAVGGPDAATNILGASPLLGKLAHNGGPTMTCLPRSKSPLLGAGSNPSVPPLARDQRGFVRQQGGTIDIGSVEVA